MGEFGATLMIAGNIPGKTQTMPLAIFFSVESGDMSKAYTMGYDNCFNIIYYDFTLKLLVRNST